MQVPESHMMFIMMDLSSSSDASDQKEHILVAMFAYPGGSLDMRPGFSSPGKCYRFEDHMGMKILTGANPVSPSQFGNVNDGCYTNSFP